MHRYSFPISCLLISISAFLLLTVSAQGVAANYLSLVKSYGGPVIVLVTLLIVAQFMLTAVSKVFKDRGKNVSQNEKIAWYKAYVKSYSWLNVLSATAALIVTTTSFTVYKGAVVGAGGYGFDATFIAWDRMLLGGNDAWVLTHAVFGSATITKWFDFLYHPAFLPMLIAYLLCITSVGLKPLRQTYMLSYLVSFVLIGMISASALHSAGPVFDGVLYGNGSTFGPLMDRLQSQLAAGGGPQTADLIRQYLIDLHQSEGINLGAGISAMPSMHMVFVFLWVFPAWNISRIFGMIVALYAGIIWIGSVHLGWHYFVDGLVSLAMVSIIWRITGHMVGLYTRPQVIRATT